MTCPCCGYPTIGDVGEICTVCFWEYDALPWGDLYEPEGPNAFSLSFSQECYAEYGASELRFLRHVRPPTVAGSRDPRWRPLDPALDHGDRWTKPYWL